MTATPTAEDLLRHLVPAPMAADLADHLDDLPFVAEQVTTYLGADATSRREMELFHEGDGLGMVRDAVARLDPEPTPEIPEALPPEIGTEEDGL